MPEVMNLETLRDIIVEVFPELAGANFSLLAEGWDSLAVDVDDALIFKFPREEGAAKALEMEAQLLVALRPALTMPVPDMALFRAPRLFSRHAKLKGEHLLAADYERLPDEDRQHLARAMAQFFAELHRLDPATMAAAGATPLEDWPSPDYIRSRALPLLLDEQQSLAEATIAAWEALPADPLGTIYGFFDGHGWNMAFDHERGRLNGVYDFADSGLGSLHQELSIQAWFPPI